MRKRFDSLRDTFIAGLIFLLPILIVFVLISKVFMFFRNFTTRLAALFGLKSIMGISASTIMGVISLIIICILCGYLMRVALFKHFSEWTDYKLRKLLPGYEVYRQMALSKLEKKEDVLPYESAAFVKIDDGLKPAFIMETMPDGRMVVFFPSAGNVKEGELLVLESDKVERCPDYNMRDFRMAINNLGLGFSKVRKAKKES